MNDLQIFVRHPITIKYSDSKNLIFLRGDKISRDDSISKAAVYKFLRGRQFFERLEDFSQRAEQMSGIVGGKIFRLPSRYKHAQLVYADFCASGDLPAIKNLYLITSYGMCLDIFSCDVPNFEDLVFRRQRLRLGTHRKFQ